MFVQVFETFSAFHNFWFTTLSNSLNFSQLDNLFSLLYEYLFFFGINVLCSLPEAFQCSGSRNIRRLKLVSR